MVALIWANIDIAFYTSVWHADSIRPSDVQVTRDLRTWINTGLPTLFFLVERWRRPETAGRCPPAAA